MNTHLISGIAALALLTAGWLAATYFIARRAKGKRERRFLVQAGIAVLAAILLVSFLDAFLLNSHGAVFGVVLFLTFFVLRRKQLAIRAQE